MSVLVMGLSHRTGPVSLLERVSLGGEGLTKLLTDAATSENVQEIAALSTCNRMELYAEVDKFHGGLADLSELLCRHTGFGLEQLRPHLYVHYEDRAVQHLFSVACGLDSMVVGESQILGQIKTALSQAQELGTAGRVLNDVVQQALRVGKLARSTTAIDQAGRSLVGLGLEQATAVLGPLAGRRALVVGAGSMSALAATSLVRQGVGALVVANRTPERAARLAGALGARAVAMEDVVGELGTVDLVVCCTGAVGQVLSVEDLRVGRFAAGDAPLVVLDLAMPHDVDPDVNLLPGVTLFDLNALAGAAADGTPADVEAVRRIVAAEVGVFTASQRASQVAPTVVALRSMAEDVVSAEMLRLRSRLPGLDARAQEEIARSVRRVVDKLLHGPTVRVKELAGGPDGETYAAALRELFDLDRNAVEAVTRPGVSAEEAAEAALSLGFPRGVDL
ncbi:MAG: glutamyl-tRNA reductase [Sporichthyaceae bacterium]